VGQALPAIRKLLLLALFLFLNLTGFCQHVLVNSPSALYELDQSGSLCNIADAGAFCNPTQQPNFIFSIALHKDTLYFISRNSELFQMVLGKLGTCRLLTQFPANGFSTTSINSLAVDKNGILYTADFTTADVIQYNPYTDKKKFLGSLNCRPAGDMIFYKNKLLLATATGAIYEVNLNNPSASTEYISSTYIQFYGLISVPYNCYQNKYYGLAATSDTTTSLYELDLENRQVLGVSCTVPIPVYDGASNFDDGNTLGVSIDSLIIKPPCGNSTKANLMALAYSASTGNLNYTLDDTLINTTGSFDNLIVGSHKLNVKNQRGCSSDTVFTIYKGLSNEIIIAKTNTQNCLTSDGIISVSAFSGYSPLSYSIDGGNLSYDSVFKNQSSGLHSLSIVDAKGCTKDTSILLGYVTNPDFFTAIESKASRCNSKTGSIAISLNAGIDLSTVTTSLNKSVFQHTLNYNGLDSGFYLLSILSNTTCRYDTMVHVQGLVNPPPIVTINVTNQKCFADNGSIQLSINGSDGPYKTSINSQAFSSNSLFQNLKPGNYSLAIADKDGCSIDTSAQIVAYPLVPVQLDININAPICKEPKSGWIKLSISGTENPYSFSVGNNKYSNYSTINNLTEGRYHLAILNKDLCVVDTNTVTLNMKVSPDCDLIYVPNAFTPNGDGLNDIFKPIVGYSVNYYDFKIFNRWGELVFQTLNKNIGWAGTVSGKRQATGVFTWVVSYNTQNNSTKKVKKGTVVLIQ
jgi:gliding motility-associated-like protein